MPQQRPHKSRQDYQTPPEFLLAVKKRLFIRDFALDVAASRENAVASRFYTEETNGLTNTWHTNIYYPGGADTFANWTWCNPPYNDIEQWVAKAAIEAKKGANITMLVPASVGANWWRDWVENHAYVLFLNGRLTFVGCDTPYPKDCALLLYTPMRLTGNQVWCWRN